MFFDLKIALSSLRAHRLRTILAMVGVFLGALALTGVQHVSEGMLLKAKVETAKLGTNLFIARSGQVHFRRSGSASVHNEARTFTLADARALMDALPSARLGAPFVSQTAAIRAGNTKVPCQLVATWPTYPRVRNFVPEYGHFFTGKEEDRRAKVCVLGRKIAERLFGRPQAAVGQEVFFSTASARVIGVMEEKGADITGTDQDEQVFVPLTTYMRRLSNQDWISGVYLQLADAGNYARAKKAAEHLLRVRHRVLPGQKDDFSVLTAQDTMQVQQQALDLVQTLGIISSSVSFAVGGLGHPLDHDPAGAHPPAGDRHPSGRGSPAAGHHAPVHPGGGSYGRYRRGPRGAGGGGAGADRLQVGQDARLLRPPSDPRPAGRLDPPGPCGRGLPRLAGRPRRGA